MPAPLTLDAAVQFSWLDMPMWVFDVEAPRIVWANASALAFWHAPDLATLSARDFSDLSPASRTRLRAVLNAAPEHAARAEPWTLYPDGAPVTVSLVGRPVLMPDGRLCLLFLSTAEPVAQLEPMVLRGLTAMHHTTVCVAMHHLDGGVVLMRNPAAIDAFGPVIRENNEDTFCRMFANPADGRRILALVGLGQHYSAEVPLLTLNGEHWYDIDVRAVRDPATGELAAQMNAHDITSLKATQHALELARDAAQAANRAKSSFLAHMSHEIRTPMNGVMGLTEVVLRSELTERQRELLTMAQRSARSLMGVINDILDLSKIEANRMTLEAVDCDLHDLAQESADAFTLQAHEKNLSLHVSISPEVPRRVSTDPLRLRQVLQNLLSNAVKFTRSGGIRLEVSLTEAYTQLDGLQLPPQLQFCVTDTGIGMSAAEVARVFAPFMQADPSITRVYGGTGLGLAIVRGLVDRMGGGVSVRSAPGQGSSFTVILPRVPAAGTAEVSIEHPAQWARLHGKRVLLVEDNAVNQTVASAMLEQLGALCVVAGHGEAALQCLRREPFDAVLMDLQMPVLDGMEATRRWRQHEDSTGLPRTPVIAFTAHALDDDRERCRLAGMDGFVSKPVDADALARALDALIP